MCFIPFNSPLLTSPKDCLSKDKWKDVGRVSLCLLEVYLCIYLCDLNIIIIHSCLLLSRVTSKVLSSVTLGILHLGSCHSLLISEHLKSQCHIRDGNRVEHNRGLSPRFLSVCERLHTVYCIANTTDRIYELGKCYHCNKNKCTVNFLQQTLKVCIPTL